MAKQTKNERAAYATASVVGGALLGYGATAATGMTAVAAVGGGAGVGAAAGPVGAAVGALVGLSAYGMKKLFWD